LQNELFLIEDVSQAHGAKMNGSRLGSLGDIATFSCYPTKNLGAIGDAGLVATKDPELARKVKMLREYGWENRYVSEFPGRNSRLDELQAAILRIKLRGLDRDNEKRRQIAKVYQDSLTGLDLHLPQIRAGAEHVFHLYVLRCNFQKNIIGDLKKDGINLGIHYPLAVHQQNAYSNRVRTSSMEVTDQLSRQVVSLPIYPELLLSDVHQVSAAVRSWVESQ
jgi:dTDP-4-amino-4,6-dideoxygalactose transaminase